ncbi:MAG TPA: hypothetical protein VN753_04560 [Terracidiphilus sp.]|nr:hypothetical protein [Terracidiphilus sp.]
MQNLLQYQERAGCRSGVRQLTRSWVYALFALVWIATFPPASAKAQSTGDPTPNALELGPRCPTCPIVIPSRPLSMKDKEDRADRRVQKKNYAVANTVRKKYIDDETNKMLILARDLNAKLNVLGSARPTTTMQREAAMIEFLAKDIKEKMKLTVNPD